MNLDLNNVIKGLKDNEFVQNFLEELSKSLEKESNNFNELYTNGLKQEGGIYQVVEITGDGVYLKNTQNDLIEKETDISQELIDNIIEDSVLKFENGEYRLDDELTEKFMNSLVDIRTYKEMQEKFINESNSLGIDLNNSFKLEEKNDEFSILDCDGNKIEVQNGLIPFWSNVGDMLIFNNGRFERKF